jgi:hypothetical protein
MRHLVAISCIVLAAAALGEVPTSQPASRAARPDTISVGQQLRLKRKLLMGQESLIAVLQENRKSWDRYTPEQRQQLRDRAYAFRQADPIRQEQVVGAWERYMKLTDDQKERYRQRAQWLSAVVAELSPQARAELIKLPPQERASRLLELKGQLEAKGKLPAASQPTSAPAE